MKMGEQCLGGVRNSLHEVWVFIAHLMLYLRKLKGACAVLAKAMACHVLTWMAVRDD